jgi:hypothetical protein
LDKDAAVKKEVFTGLEKFLTRQSERELFGLAPLES